ncbi:MAG: DNA polymerase IV [Pseudomonadota bacterium]
MAEKRDIPALCLGCGAILKEPPGASCPACSARRIIRHVELLTLSVAHIDCDAFYASIEKRDDPSLADRPVIVGGGVRGVVTTACYIARTYGVRSAMPMFRALQACPEAVVIKPDLAKYSSVGREVREMMEQLTPLVEPVSIDEAFLDLTGTARVHKMPPAAALARLQREIKREIGISVSVGLSFNKFLAKTASDFDKPNGFSIIGESEAKSVLARLPVGAIWGVGAVMAKRLNADGYQTIADLQRADAATLARRYGEIGMRLADLSNGRDRRRVAPSRETKSVSSETTFNTDTGDLKTLEDILWRLSERTSARMKAKKFAGTVVTLKLKTADFKTITRRATLPRPSNLARTAFDAAKPLLAESAGGRAFRLIGIGYSDLAPETVSAQADMFAGDEEKIRREEGAIDAIRKKFGDGAIALGRNYAKKPRIAPITDSDGENDE